MNTVSHRDAFLKLLAVISLICAAYTLSEHFGDTAVVWPASDNLPAVCRYLDPDCLAADFFTNASSKLNPRYPYSVLLGQLTIAAQNGLGGGIAIAQSMLLVLLPILCAVLLVSSVATFAPDTQNPDDDGAYWRRLSLAALLALFLVFHLQDGLGSHLSIAWWHPMQFVGSANNVAMMLGFAGALLLSRGWLWLGCLTALISGILHPVTGLFTILFSSLVLYRLPSPAKRLRLMAAGLFAAVTAALVSKFVFDLPDNLSTQAFVDIYVRERHSAHYLPSEFGTFRKYKWQTSFAVVCLGLAAIAIWLKYLGNSAWRNAALALVCYSGAVVVQYLLVEVLPVKIIAAIGPSRFTLFGPWFLLIFGSVLLLDRSACWVWANRLADAVLRLSSRVNWLLIAAAYTVLFGAAGLNSRNAAEIDTAHLEIEELVSFALEEMGEGDVIMMPYASPRVQMPLVTDRAVFIGNGFPFSQSDFEEWLDRYSAAYGSRKELESTPGDTLGSKRSEFFRQHNPADFVRIASSRRLDWVVVETSHSEQFRLCDHALATEKFYLYSIQSLRACK